MTTSALVSQRLINQKLASSSFKKPVEVVRWLGAVQAQDFGAAKWALGMRMLTATDAAIEKAFNEGKILRTHVMRPTWHFVAPEDMRWLLQLTGPRVKANCGSYFRKLELDDALFKRTNRVLIKALSGGEYLTRAALQKLLNKAGVDANDPIRLSHIVLRAELDQVVCSGPRIGKQFTYALFDERVPATKPLNRDEALAKLALRYFISHGPATLHDFVWWSGLTVKDAQLSITLAGGRLEKVSINARDYWISPGTQSTPSLYPAHLLPAFDEYTVAYKDRQDFAAQQSMTKMGLLGPLIVTSGHLAGTWDKNSGTIALRPLRTLTKSDKSAITAAVGRYATFLGTPVQQKYEK